MASRLLLLALGVLSGPVARAAEPWDPGYSEPSSRQTRQTTRRIHQIVSPTVSCPVLALAGGEVKVLLRAGAGVPVPRPAELRARIVSARGVGCAAEVRAIGLRRGLVQVTLRVPWELARDVYDLEVMGPGFRDRQPNAVRVTGAAPRERYRIVVMSDHQLWDPSYRVSGRQINAEAYPRPDAARENEAIARQGFREVALLDPEFVLYTGDLLFGLDYGREYDEMVALLREARLPVFAVPGNHDGYAIYAVRLKGGAVRLLGGAVSCRSRLEGELSWQKAWNFVTCLYGDVKPHLFAELERDGLVDWARQLGPPAYAFAHGRLRFVGLNTYDGSPERRHAFALYVDAFDLHLGAPAVDNYGGYLSEAQLRFVREQAEQAEREGRRLVVFGHHDPRGNAEGTAYHANLPFPTDPLSLEGFDEWNYDAESWNSDPRAAPRKESAEQNSGVALLGILARYGGYYLSGHVHRDSRRSYPAGSRLGPHAVARPVEFIRTTTAASSVQPGGYWGYRVLEVDGDTLRGVDYAPELGLSSVPVGNLWTTATTATEEREVVYGLPRPARLSLRFTLPRRAEGYRFRVVRAAGDAKNGEARGAPVTVDEIAWEPTTTTYAVGLEVRAAEFPPRLEAYRRMRVRAEPAAGNRPPDPWMRFAVEGVPADRSATASMVRVGQSVVFHAGGGDPDGDRIVDHQWTLGGRVVGRGPRWVHRFAGLGSWQVGLVVADEAGSRGSVVRKVEVLPPSAAGCGGCAGPAGGADPGLRAGVAVLAAIGLARARRGSRTGKRAREGRGPGPS